MFFDNVGGEILDAVLARIALRARIVLCGGISGYNEKEPPPGPRNLMNLVRQRGRMEGLIVLDYAPRFAEGDGAARGLGARGRARPPRRHPARDRERPAHVPAPVLGREPRQATAAGGRAEETAMIYDSILDTIGNTPVVRLHRIAPPGVEMFVKVEAFNPGGSVKDRLAYAIVTDAERRGQLKPGQTVVEATSGNTGIALAMVCAARGYPFVATMVETFSIERRKVMRALGAKVILTPAAERGSGMVKRAEELAAKHGWFLARQFENPANPEYHRNTTGPEILRDFANRRLDYWVTGWGTGGTLTGAGQVIKAARPEVKIIATEPEVASLLGGQGMEAAQDPGLDARLPARRARPERPRSA